MVGSNAERLASAGTELGEDALLVLADLRKPADVTRAVEEARSKFGKINVVFANAGSGVVAPLAAITPAQIEEHFSLNFTGLLLTIQKTAPLIPREGSIIATSSFLNSVGVPGHSLLAATKAAVRSLVRTLGAELAPHGIRVNAISPGAITTPFYGKLGLSEEQVSSAAAAIQAKVPLQRFGSTSEIAKTALFLASDDSSYTTGAELVVDGGLTQF